MKYEKITTLITDYEPEIIIKWLSNILTSPKVWKVSNGEFIPIDVLNSETIIKDNSLLSINLSYRNRKVENFQKDF